LFYVSEEFQANGTYSRDVNNLAGKPDEKRSEVLPEGYHVTYRVSPNDGRVPIVVGLYGGNAPII
jgi:hypothetical protein